MAESPGSKVGLRQGATRIATSASHIVAEWARRLLGKDWLEDYLKAANAGGIERVLL
jgi:hypothetical protein